MRLNYAGGKLGDLILSEPAMAAAGDVSLFVAHESLRVMFANHPTISLVDAWQPDGIELSAEQAFWWAANHGAHFSCGYFPQLGLESGRWRCHFQLFGLGPRAIGDYVVFAPFAYSCSAPLSGVGNITWPLSCWAELLALMPMPVVALGGPDDPLLPGCVNVRGAAWGSVIELMRAARGLVSVETGLLHLGGACCDRVVFLSSATPAGFADPAVDRLAVVRAAGPNWSVADVAQAIEKVLE